MDQHSIKNVKNPADRLDAVNKSYADRMKYKSVTGNIPNTLMIDHKLSRCESICQLKYKICEIYVEWLADEWIAT